MKIYVYAGCSTCKKALKWLKERGVEPTVIPIVDTPPDAATLAQIRDAAGVPTKKLFNVSGQSYRQGGWKEKIGDTSEAEQLAALAADGKLIKRPLLVTENGARVGFKEESWAELLDA